MCLVIDKDSKEQIEALQTSQPTIKGYSAKHKIDGNVSSIFYPKIWGQGANVPNKILWGAPVQHGLHFCFNRKDLSDCTLAKCIIIECVVQTRDITAVGTIDGFPDKAKGFICTQAEWDGEIITFDPTTIKNQEIT